MPDSAIVSLLPLGKKLKVNLHTPLLDILNEFGVEFPCGGKGTCGSCKVKLLKGTLAIGKSQQQKLDKLKLDENWRLACYCNVESDITLQVSQLENFILADNSEFEFIPQKGFGIAVDVGTTTLVAQLVNLENGSVLDSVSEVNPQTKFGADLISRIQHCLDGKTNQLQNLIRKKTRDLVSKMLTKHPVDVSKIVLVGNTVMHHIFCGIPANPLSQYPFYSPHLEMQEFTTSDLGWEIPGNPKIQFYPSIGSFVGSDILAGIAATKMAEREEFSILIDLGTNGEIAIGNQEKILCASTAAGPAFEGAKISQGMRAASGAISSVSVENEKMVAHVIGNSQAKGICGSGLIDVMALLLDQEKIGLFGEINSGQEQIKIAENVAITQQDIREFQLAKAALATGVQLMLNQMKLTFSEIDKVYIAGGFGNFLNLRNVIRTGLIECDEEKIVKIGNTALIGAKMFLFDDESKTQQILQKTMHLNLEGNAAFQDIYIEKMMLV